MRLPDRETLKATLASRSSFVFSCVQHIGKRSRQEDVFLEEDSEVFVLADGMGGLPNGDIAAQLTAESALWTIKLLKKRPSYWRNKKLVGQRIIHSTNRTVFNKRKEELYGIGMGSTILVVLFGERNVNVYAVGDTLCGRYRSGVFSLITPPQRDEQGYLLQAIGIEKTSPTPFFFHDEWKTGDIYLLATDGVIDWVNIIEIETICGTIEYTQESLTLAGNKLIEKARNNGSTDNMSACFITSI